MKFFTNLEILEPRNELFSKAENKTKSGLGRIVWKSKKKFSLAIK